MSVLYDSPRAAAVAGMFYPGDARSLKAEVHQYLGKPITPEKALGVMVPHAGYVYSGALCGHVLARVEIPETVLILHTKHRPGGGDLSLAAYEAWRTPLGELPTDRELTDALDKPPVVVSNRPHGHDHAAEVVLPFLQVLRPDVRVAVISVGHTDYRELLKAAANIAAAIKAHARGVLIVSSSDMNHYEGHTLTLAKDEKALERLRAFDPRGMLEVCLREDISMCGAFATALMVEACKLLGATGARVIEHTTSGPTSGDMEQVVGYATAVVS
ncbi:MAG: AmmeMemoRadiSam system protein B [Planctomycetes bacterium]|nr:AmmeMemoRadiSam system protein B [Planctomycetota bacterium]